MAWVIARICASMNVPPSDDPRCPLVPKLTRCVGSLMSGKRSKYPRSRRATSINSSVGAGRPASGEMAGWKSTELDMASFSRSDGFHERQRELVGAIEPLSDQAKPCALEAAHDFLGAVLVRALGPHAIAGAHRECDLRRADVNILRRAGDEVHLDPRFCRIPDRLMGEFVDVEVAVELSIDANE